MLEVVRRPMLGSVPELRYYLVAIVLALAVFTAGVYVQVRTRKKIAYML